MKTLIVEYDAASQSVWIKLSDEPIEQTCQMGRGVNIDMDASNKPVGVEILDVKEITVKEA